MVCRKVQYYMKYYVNSCKQTFFESIHRIPVDAAEESQETFSNIAREIMEASSVLLHRD